MVHAHRATCIATFRAMAGGRHLKTLFEAFHKRDAERFQLAASAIIAEEEAKQHHRLADDLRHALGESGSSTVASQMQPLSSPSGRGDASSLVEHVEPARKFDDLVLDPVLVKQLRSVATEHDHADTLIEHGVSPRRKLLFWGPPGCGKSSAAEALARELGWPLSIVRLDAIIQSYLGETSSNLRSVFESVRWDRQVLLFDEFDALGRERDDAHDAGEMKRIVSSLLMLIERFTGPGVMIAATNHDDLLDAALWRRFDDVAHFDRPDKEQVCELLRRRLGGIHPDSGLDVAAAAEQLGGQPHAAVEHAVWNAYRAQIVAGDNFINDEAMQAAITRTTERPW